MKQWISQGSICEILRRDRHHWKAKNLLVSNLKKPLRTYGVGAHLGAHKRASRQNLEFFGADFWGTGGKKPPRARQGARHGWGQFFQMREHVTYQRMALECWEMEYSLITSVKRRACSEILEAKFGGWNWKNLNIFDLKKIRFENITDLL